MIGIVVTIPKSRQQVVEAEEREVAEAAKRGVRHVYYWTLGTRPPVQAGDRLYFVWNGAVRAYHDIICAKWDEGIGRWCVWMKPEIHHVEPVTMESFRGWRYYEHRPPANVNSTGQMLLEASA